TRFKCDWSSDVCSSDLEAEDELRALVAVETGCCAWAAWTVEQTAGAVALGVRSADPGGAPLHSLVRLPSATLSQPALRRPACAPASAWSARPPAGAGRPSGARCARKPG